MVNLFKVGDLFNINSVCLQFLGLQSCVLKETSHRRAPDAYPSEPVHMIFFLLRNVLPSMCCGKKRKQNEKEIRRNCCNDLCSLYMVL